MLGRNASPDTDHLTQHDLFDTPGSCLVGFVHTGHVDVQIPVKDVAEDDHPEVTGQQSPNRRDERSHRRQRHGYIELHRSTAPGDRLGMTLPNHPEPTPLLG